MGATRTPPLAVTGLSAQGSRRLDDHWDLAFGNDIPIVKLDLTLQDQLVAARGGFAGGDDLDDAEPDRIEAEA